MRCEAFKAASQVSLRSMRTLGGVSCHVVEKFKREAMKREGRGSPTGRGIEKSRDQIMECQGGCKRCAERIGYHSRAAPLRLDSHSRRPADSRCEWVNSISHAQTVLRGIPDAVAFSS